jgi:DNA-binding LytR/AlgR family response regulator
MDIYEFRDGNALLTSDAVFDIVFLDYQMPNLNGMDTARQLRARNSICNIVFVTNFPDFVFESFEVNPYRFYKKPISPNEIESMFDFYIRQQKALSPIIINDFDGQKVIASKNIIYLEGDGKYCLIRTVSETVHSSKTLSGVMQMLPQYCFYRIHKSYVVNLYYIDRIDNNLVYFINGEKAVIGRNNIGDFNRAYRNFVKNYYLRA